MLGEHAKLLLVRTSNKGDAYTTRVEDGAGDHKVFPIAWEQDTGDNIFN